MSCFTCKLCDQQKDCDYDGCYEYEDGLICEDCNNDKPDLFKAMGLPEIPKIPKVTKKCVEVGMDGREIWRRAIDMLNEIHEKMGIDDVIKAKMERLAVDKIAEKHLQKLLDDLPEIKPKVNNKCREVGMDTEETTEVAELIVNGYVVTAQKPLKELAQAHLDLKKRWDGLDEPSEEMCVAGISAVLDLGLIDTRVVQPIFKAMIKEVKNET